MNIARSVNKFVRKVPAWPLYIVGALPGLVLFYRAVNNQLGADPLKVLEHQLGEWALQLLVACLLVTPIRALFNIQLVKFRRAIGLLAFFYVIAHLLTYLWLDQQWWFSAIWKDITKRPYIIIGMIAFVSMIPLAVTSNNRAIRKMGPKAWGRLHRLVYISMLGGAVHYVLLAKTWQQEPITYVLIALGFLGYRIWREKRHVN